MPVTEQYQQIVDTIYEEGVINEEIYEDLAQWNNAGNAEKLAIGYTKTALTITDMLDDLEPEFQGTETGQEIEELTQWAENYEFIDWEDKTVREEQIDQYLEQQVQNGQNATATGGELLEEVYDIIGQAVNTWNQAYTQLENTSIYDDEEDTDPFEDDTIEPDTEPKPETEPTDETPDWMPDTDDDTETTDETEDDEPLFPDDDDDPLEPEDEDDDPTPLQPDDTEDEDDDLINVYAPTGIVGKIGSLLTREKKLRGPYHEEGDE